MEEDRRQEAALLHPPQDDRPIAFAGLWERWRRDEERIESCTIIVTDANDLLEPIHDRMPVIRSISQVKVQGVFRKRLVIQTGSGDEHVFRGSVGDAQRLHDWAAFAVEKVGSQ